MFAAFIFSAVAVLVASAPLPESLKNDYSDELK